MEDERLTEAMRRQDGVVSRAQVVDCGGDDVLIERRLRRREWARIHEGVYVDHTGPTTWRQRAWAAVLVHAPSALAGASALIAHGLAFEDGEPIELVVDRARRVDDPAGVTTSQLRAYDDVVLAHLGPPRVRVEHAVLTVASRARTVDASVATIAHAVQRRRTTAERLVEALEARPRLRRRALLREVLADVATGAYSALERRYLRDVERAHHLPTGLRQVRGEPGSTVVFRDVEYADLAVLVELDGRLGHEDVLDVWDDLERDLSAATDGRVTLRARWEQVLDACRLAGAIATILRSRGWAGDVRSCGAGCGAGCGADRRGSPAPGAGDPRSSSCVS